ncbi:G-type lectin S-receptor-like serine/threonine-protein kinase CES101 [Rhodamnia argentea]|uniref:Receptor-like serine/threonine-protein kinase n=1 Tax=Rhodamnia argentea TaxID=178133 RepID=A0A8B8QUI2_9MYRT|nr:G-type lectin S-receptor-like serine/threonine-protein kinase CES101 [Rhodamnia argentea]
MLSFMQRPMLPSRFQVDQSMPFTENPPERLQGNTSQRLENSSSMATAQFSLSDMFTKFCVFLVFCSCCLRLSEATNTLLPGQDLKDNKTLVSSNEEFALGFFRTGGSSSSNYYLGIWFKDDPYKVPVWVANREQPIPDSSGVLSIRSDGNLVISDRRLIQVLVNPAMLATNGSTVARLLDSGSFVLLEGESTVWESFYYPSDTFLPGMKLGFFNLGTEKARDQFLVSWQSPSVPSTGSFVLALMATMNKTQLMFHRDDVSRVIRYLDEHRFRSLLNSLLEDYDITFVSDAGEMYLTYDTSVTDRMSWFVLSPSGQIKAFTKIGKEISAVYSPICTNTSSGSSDCHIDKPALCPNANNFRLTEGSVPKPNAFNELDHLGISDCEIMCRRNCSCNAFGSYRDDGTGCQFFYGDLNFFADETGQRDAVMLVRWNINETAAHVRRKAEHWSKRLLWLVLIAPVVLLVVSAMVSISRWRNSRIAAWKNKMDTARNLGLFLIQLGSDVSEANQDSRYSKLISVRKRDHELPILSFSCVSAATGNFSAENKLGEGGFGPVYKGMLLGHEIAVKRLSRKSGQGLEEFKNEVQVILKLQHRNLVRLLGCCIERDEKILVYEYLANKSLDSFLFDPNKKPSLEWKRRVRIIEGIAQGLLYLHQYSRLRVIHRDLKTSNILLDSNMNPKISDFGMARIFGENQAQAKTARVVGTYGYMSPEYAVHGLFSVKSDVFSFGVIMLEIISGRKNTMFAHSDHSVNLLGYAWELWKFNRGVELMDPALANPSSFGEFSLCLHIALLCVQEHPKDRPSTSDVVQMLGNKCANLPSPRPPPYCSHIGYCSSQERQEGVTNDLTCSTIEAR